MDQGSFSVSKQSCKSETLVGWKLKVSVSISQTSHPQTSIPIFDAFKLHKKSRVFNSLRPAQKETRVQNVRYHYQLSAMFCRCTSLNMLKLRVNVFGR